MNIDYLAKYIKNEKLTVISYGTSRQNLALFEVYLNKKQIIFNHNSNRGINVVVIREENSKFIVESHKIYDFWNSDLNKIIRNDIMEIQSDRIIIIGIKEDGSKKLNLETRNFFTEYCKSTYAMEISKHQSWALVIKKIALKGIEKVSESYEQYQHARIDGLFHLTFIKPKLPEIYNNSYSFNPNLISSSNVKEKTRQLKQILNKTESINEKFKIMNNYYQDEECYIISCGPSLNNYPQNLIKNIAGKAVVITIKQAFDVYADITDFHVLNWCNYQLSTYNNNIISIYMSEKDSISKYHDITLSLDPIYYINRIRNTTNKIPPLSKSCRFNDYLFEKRIKRPEGPGIMYEIPIYLAIHLGCKKITILGWDLNYKLPQSIHDNSHFYGTNPHTNKHIIKIINENDYIIASTPILYKWLKSLNIDLFIISNQSKVNNIIPRVNPETIYNQIIKNENTIIQKAISEIEINQDKLFENYMTVINQSLLEKLTNIDNI